MLYYFTLYLIFILANKAVVSKNYSKFSLQNCLVTQNNTIEVWLYNYAVIIINYIINTLFNVTLMDIDVQNN